MRRAPVPSLVYMSSALPALGKHSTRHLRCKAHVMHADDQQPRHCKVCRV